MGYKVESLKVPRRCVVEKVCCEVWHSLFPAFEGQKPRNRGGLCDLGHTSWECPLRFAQRREGLIHVGIEVLNCRDRFFGHH